MIATSYVNLNINDGSLFFLLIRDIHKIAPSFKIQNDKYDKYDKYKNILSDTFVRRHIFFTCS